MHFAKGRLVLVASLLLTTAAGCKSETAERCEAAVHHMNDRVVSLTDSRPKDDEQRIIDFVTKASIDQCLREGISKAQADCILSVQTMEQLMDLADCPAIAAKRPSWLRVAPSRAEIEELRRKLDAELRDAGT